MLSPSKELDVTTTPSCKISTAKKSKVDDKNETDKKLTQNRAADDSGFLTRISTLAVRSPEIDKPKKSEENIPYKIKSRTQLFAPDKPSVLETPRPSVFQNKVDPGKRKEEDLIKIQASFPRVPLSNRKDPEVNQLETPYKKNDQQMFVTPSARPPIAKNTSILSTCERDENKRPKILFTTPGNRSIFGTTPISQSQRKLSPIKEPPTTEKSIERPNENILVINNVEYEVDKKIGSGGSSTVFLARGRKSRKECAIKLVNLDADPAVVEGYLNETKCLAKLQGNINVVALYDYCHLPQKSILYMVMEKGDSDLHKILQTYTTHIPLYSLVNYWYQILQAVNYIHQNGVIHSDLKPGERRLFH